MNKIKLGVVYGGLSAEHEISILSARSIIKHASKEIFDVIPIYIDLKNRWFINYEFISHFEHEKFAEDVVSDLNKVLDLDVVFPIIHGFGGEDGKIQGFFETLQIPIVGSYTLSSAISMNKSVTKNLAKLAGINVVDFLMIEREDYDIKGDVLLEDFIKNVGFPIFIKPDDGGSSIGTVKVKSRAELIDSIKEVFQYSNNILIEKAINAREIEVAILKKRSGELLISEPGEILLNGSEFYSFEAKYIDKIETDIVAKIKSELRDEIQSLAKKAWKSSKCEGFARIDFLLDKGTNELYLNEVNTIPGFTEISLYPKMMNECGILYHQIIEELVYLAIQKHSEKAFIQKTNMAFVEKIGIF